MQDSRLSNDDRRSRHSNGLRVVWIWLIICLLVFLFWASTYRSIVEVFAEWQFAHFGRYYPSLTVSFIVLLLASLIAAPVGWVRRRRRRRGDKALEQDVAPNVLMTRAIRSADRSRLFFAGTALVTALVAIGVFVSMLWLPSDKGPVRTVAGLEGSVQPQGAAAYARPFRIGRVARIVENVGLARRVMYVAPVYLPHQPDENSFLTMVDPSPVPPLRFSPIMSGLLVEQGLPGELVNLYRAVGVTMPQRSYLLMRDGATVRWRPLVLGVQTALLALVAACVSLLFGRQVRRLRKVVTDQRSLPTP